MGFFRATLGQRPATPPSAEGEAGPNQGGAEPQRTPGPRPVGSPSGQEGPGPLAPPPTATGAAVEGEGLPVGSNKGQAPPGAPLSTARSGAPGPAPLFGSQVGGKGAFPPKPTPPNQALPSMPPRCPLCRGATEDDDGIWRCLGRCQGRWLPVAGTLVDLATLPFGACRCCHPREALVAGGDGGPICPRQATPYLMTPQGPLPLEEAAPEGLCHCCLPARPLVRQGGALVCPAKPTHHYLTSPSGEVRFEVVQPGATTEAVLQAIDEALRQNSATLTKYGLFDP